MGINAKRPLKKLERIMLAGFQGNQAAAPKGNSGQKVIPWHSCAPNSFTFEPASPPVARILVAKRDIQPGEEITVCLVLQIDPEYPIGNAEPKELLLKKGIVCPADCSRCSNKEFLSLVKEAKRLNQLFWKVVEGKKRSDIIDVTNSLLKVLQEIGESYNLERFNLDMFVVKKRSQDAIPEALEYGGRMLAFRRYVGHPKS